MATYYRDSSNRSVSDRDIALRWIAENPEEARKALSRAGPQQPRPFAIHGKATKDGRVSIHRVDEDDDG